MEISDLLTQLKDEISAIHSSDFEIEITKTNYVPTDTDSSLTFENFDLLYKKVKTLETCVLFIDIRKSTKLNLKHYPKTMAKLYSSFIRSMIKAAEYFGGKIRNIIGDRLMVVFDSSNCYEDAVNTAFLMNTICNRIINKKFKNNAFKCGIGIDFGKMMVTKCGTIKYGSENSTYKSLVWLGKPANIASKLTDSANKPSTSKTVNGFNVGFHYKYINEWNWYFETPEELVDNIKFSYISPNMAYKNDYFRCFHTRSKTISNNDATPPILISNEVFQGLKRNHPNEFSIKNKRWKKQTRKIPNYTGPVYGCDVEFTW